MTSRSMQAIDRAEPKLEKMSGASPGDMGEIVRSRRKTTDKRGAVLRGPQKIGQNGEELLKPPGIPLATQGNNSENDT
uniref:Uncharacterized protein n=1 Tax=Trichobilharzia regenti TaxID=157069 RepID=A0AA85K1W1_TRIRE|nr:unnamed protein product [Trichobilharzia regenti]